jgi:hypothetical protein
MEEPIEALDAVEVRVLGQDQGDISKSDIEQFLSNLSVSKSGRLVWPKGEQSGFISEVYYEDVFMPKLGFVRHAYIWVSSREKAEKLCALGRSRFRFSMPEQSSAERAVWKRVGKAIEKLEQIKDEIEDMGAIKTPGMMQYVLPARFVRADERYRMEMAEMDRQIKSGQVADFRYLLNKPVDLDALQTRLKILNDDRINLWILLRGFQEDGLEFKIPELDC